MQINQCVHLARDVNGHLTRDGHGIAHVVLGPAAFEARYGVAPDVKVSARPFVAGDALRLLFVVSSADIDNLKDAVSAPFIRGADVAAHLKEQENNLARLAAMNHAVNNRDAVPLIKPVGPTVKTWPHASISLSWTTQ